MCTDHGDPIPLIAGQSEDVCLPPGILEVEEMARDQRVNDGGLIASAEVGAGSFVHQS